MVTIPLGKVDKFTYEVQSNTIPKTCVDLVCQPSRLSKGTSAGSVQANRRQLEITGYFVLGQA